tara:strand:- start:221 stop:1651 length:1431 start_codon:yes stop_codon:yes gene_type:complete
MKTKIVLNFKIHLIILVFIVCLGCESSDVKKIGELPAVTNHLDQSSIDNGELSLEEIIQHGKELFVISFNTLDGAGRPEATGSNKKRLRRESPHNFNRISGPDANACSGCHNLPKIGGGGDNAANVFGLVTDVSFATLEGNVGSNENEPSLIDVTNERNTLGMFGAGLVELLAREISRDLLEVVQETKNNAKESQKDVTASLSSKGIDFGTIKVTADGFLDVSGVNGVDTDFIVKPFIQKGIIVSLREFSNTALNHHHGIQSDELFGENSDFDKDGVVNELTSGDITALTIFQATLPFPERVIPNDDYLKSIINEGEQIFDQIGCTSCHIPNLPLENTMFYEPGPFNPENTLKLSEANEVLIFDLLDYVGKLEKNEKGQYLVPLYSDLKRHKMGFELDNERLKQKGIPTDLWVTKKLWGFYDEPPFLHHGRATLLSEAILMHSGDAEESKNKYKKLNENQKDYLIEFLKTFRNDIQ